MKKFVILLSVIVLVISLITCTKEYDLDIPESEGDTTIVNIINNNYDTTIISLDGGVIRVLSTETDFPTENCRYGEIHFQVYQGSILIIDQIYCKDSVSGSESCNSSWFYQDNAEGCDTFYVFDCLGNLELAKPVCPEIVYDTITVVQPGDTTLVKIYPVLEEDFNKGNSHYYDEVLGWIVLNTGGSINSINSPNDEGTMEYYDTSMAEIIMWNYELPEFSLYEIEYDFVVGYESYDEIWGMNSLGETFLIYSRIVTPDNNYNWWDVYTWNNSMYSFTEQNPVNPQFQNLIKIGLGYRKLAHPVSTDRNTLPNRDNLKIWASKVLN